MDLTFTLFIRFALRIITLLKVSFTDSKKLKFIEKINFNAITIQFYNLKCNDNFLFINSIIWIISKRKCCV